MRPDVHGVGLDPQARCAHYHSRLDIIAIKMRCCATYYACRECHDDLADHACEPLGRPKPGTRPPSCAAPVNQVSIRQYMDCADTCPACAAPFNPGCRSHYHLYFEAAAHPPHPEPRSGPKDAVAAQLCGPRGSPLCAEHLRMRRKIPVPRYRTASSVRGRPQRPGRRAGRGWRGILRCSSRCLGHRRHAVRIQRSPCPRGRYSR